MIEVTLILPAYNEAQRIAETVSSAVAYFSQREISYEIIVSADGNDGTREVVEEMSRNNPHLKAIGNVERRGKGFGIRQAVRMADGEIIGFADADDKTPITEFDNFLPVLKAGWDVVIGSRGQRESRIERKQPWYRQIGARGFGVFMRIITGLRNISDTQCGFKFFRAEVARELFDRQKIDGYMFDVEILYLAKELGFSIKQMPVRWRDDGDTRLNLVAGNIRNFMDILSIRSLHPKEKKERYPIEGHEVKK
jgi:dolichyl-phosphate beta-glucosyltransferase